MRASPAPHRRADGTGDDEARHDARAGDRAAAARADQQRGVRGVVRRTDANPHRHGRAHRQARPVEASPVEEGGEEEEGGAQMPAVRTPGNPARLTPADLGAIAQVAHEANRAYCATIGDFSQPAWDDAPTWQRTSAIEGVQNILHGTVKVPQDSHAAWSAHKVREGWKYGPV